MTDGTRLGRLMARPWFFTLWTVVATFGCYACMYGFRKPLTAAGFGEPETKAWLVTAQVLGYAVSKFLGIKVIAEMSPASRSRTLLAIIGCAQAMLLVFALAPAPLDAACLFGNGLALGLVFGLVLGFVEGRQLTELFVAGLCASFILADGVAKTIGAALLHRGVAERWMPFTAGMLCLPPLIAFVWMLGRIPPPSRHDERARSHRPPMTVAERVGLLQRHGVGLLAIVVAYLLITILRSIRGDFAPEIWAGMGVQPQAAVFTQSELWVALLVVAANGALVLVKDNRRAFFIGLLLSGGGMVLGLVSLGAYRVGFLSPFTFMVVLGAGLYVPYVAVHTTVFERLIGLTRERANLGFLIYVADASGYLGYVAVMSGRSLFPAHEQFLGFFIGTSAVLLGAAFACVCVAMGIYAHRIGLLTKTSASCGLVLLLLARGV